MKNERNDLVLRFSQEKNNTILNNNIVLNAENFVDNKKIDKNIIFLNGENISDDNQKKDENNIIELTKAQKKEIKHEVKEILKKEEESKKDIGIKNELTKEEKVTNFFDRIEFLSLDNEQKEVIAIKVKTDALGDKLYWIEIFLSSGIAALGLLQNSVAVVIGAMLIAPLLRPINGLSFAIARGAQKFFAQAIKVMTFSIIASIFMGIFISYLVGLNIETNEIIARSTPNIIDFFIAIFSAMVAVMSLRFQRLGESVAGVAMAASLMPPLAVVGIELFIGNYTAALGAFTLFGANLIAILFVGTIFFWLYGFTPHNIQNQTKVFKRIGMVMVILLIILIPLLTSFNSIKTNFSISSNTKAYLTNLFINDIKDFYVSDIIVLSNSKNNLNLKIFVHLPEGIVIGDRFSNLSNILSTEYNKKVELEIEIIRVMKIK